MGVNLKQRHQPCSVKFCEVPVRIIARQHGWKLHASFPRQRNIQHHYTSVWCGWHKGCGLSWIWCRGATLRGGPAEIRGFLVSMSRDDMRTKWTDVCIDWILSLMSSVYLKLNVLNHRVCHKYALCCYFQPTCHRPTYLVCKLCWDFTASLVMMMAKLSVIFTNV